MTHPALLAFRENSDLARINHFEREAKHLLGEAHDLLLTDPAESLVKLDGLVAIASEWRALVERRQREREDIAESPRVHVPPVEVGDCR